VITNVAQRWRDRRDTYRPIGEVINTAHYEVAVIRDDKTAKDFVLQHHYAASYPSARFRFGLYWGGLLVGVAVFSVPANDKVLACLPGAAIENVELGRLVLLDRVPSNSETWFMARCFEVLRREGLNGAVSFSDPVPRTTPDGGVIFKGHVGGLYQSFNGIYTGLGTARTLRLLPDGSVFSDRAIQKIRSGERGWQYAAAILERHGAARLVEGADARAWLAEWMPRFTRPLRHGGNHRYLLPIGKHVRKHLPASLPYPKFTLTPPAPPALVTLAA